MTTKQLLRTTITCICLFMLHNSYAQGIRIGVRGGVLFSNMTFENQEENTADYKSITGFQVAIPVEIALGRLFAFQPELLYGAEGTRLDVSDKSVNGGYTYETELKANVRAQYLEIPLLAKLNFGPEAIRFHVLAGPSFGFGINGKSKTSGFARSTAPDGTIDFEESLDGNNDVVFKKDSYEPGSVGNDKVAFSKNNINLHFGAGLGINAGKMTLFLDGRYILGLNDLVPEAKGTSNDLKTTGKGRRIGISAGVFFPIN